MAKVYVNAPCPTCSVARRVRIDRQHLNCRKCGYEAASETRRSRPLADRFWEKVDKRGPVPTHRPDLGPCWVWTADRYPSSGYGSMTLPLQPGKRQQHRGAHRVAFLLAHGRWPDPNALHHCDNPPCVKAIADDFGPAHIFEGTTQDNVSDKIAKGRGRNGYSEWTHCKAGHEFTEANTRRGRQRFCRSCERERSRRRVATRRQADQGSPEGVGM